MDWSAKTITVRVLSTLVDYGFFITVVGGGYLGMQFFRPMLYENGYDTSRVLWGNVTGIDVITFIFGLLIGLVVAALVFGFISILLLIEEHTRAIRNQIDTQV